jgi:hypothetical protein
VFLTLAPGAVVLARGEERVQAAHGEDTALVLGRVMDALINSCCGCSCEEQMKRQETHYQWSQKYAFFRKHYMAGTMSAEAWRTIDTAYDVR